MFLGVVDGVHQTDQQNQTEDDNSRVERKAEVVHKIDLEIAGQRGQAGNDEVVYKKMMSSSRSWRR